ncbi:MAG TPA: Bax inhibitor-1/YccA family protein [Sphaerochaeta sp.]|jgi:FtsH-binding integral membrane protein|nr:Bax inhibitor-1/YccA family protein [Spirochaetota bacterium]HOE84731.1 Bax inhibitor-1/YccA family protein [Sphaerochaeta sp.]HOQ94777.1 Bax inhibitor-1/YccA family protein [Sphaerochaeta sp.]HPK46383.1 Bax inhibitor-1/YccA family protein [Sphaerochaeta sp.]
MNEHNNSILQNVQVRERTLLKNVYLWMSAGLGLTALVAYLVASSPTLLYALMGNALGMILVIVGQFALVFYLSSRLDRMSQASAIGSFLAYSTLNGVMLSSILIVYTGAMVSKAFVVSALMFASMSLYAMTTDRDLNRIGAYAGMGLWGLIIAMVLNMLFKSSAIDYLISVVGVVLFLGLTAWDTKKIVQMNQSYGTNLDEETFTKLSIIGALTLYLDAINLFLYVLRIFGRSSNNR